MTALADTSAFIAREQGRAPAPPPGEADEIAVSIVTVAELRLGVLLAGDVVSRSTRLATLQLAEALEPLPIDDRVGAAWARLVATLRAVGKRMPINDSWIAATALAHDLAVLTQDADYDVVPDLRVIKV
ncbi:MAG: type II toxin-antitoxin system VapC family toxin [Actinomycetota bacterium]